MCVLYYCTILHLCRRPSIQPLHLCPPPSPVSTCSPISPLSPICTRSTSAPCSPVSTRSPISHSQISITPQYPYLPAPQYLPTPYHQYPPWYQYPPTKGIVDSFCLHFIIMSLIVPGPSIPKRRRVQAEGTRLVP